ncbi:hypothetical protein BGW36DRAFT_259165, partial [Talaromyces proteolyticus]
MPNTGRPSRDCHACRKRRIKCDLQRPQCSQCIRKGQPCPGYRNELDMRFRTENMSTFPVNMHRDRRRRPDKKVHPMPQTRNAKPERREKKVTEHTASSLPSNDLFALQRPIHFQSTIAESWEFHVRPMIMEKFLMETTPGKNDSMFGFVPILISEAGEGTPLVLACNAVAYAYMTNIIWFPDGIQYRSSAYGSALAATNSALRDPHNFKSDNTLLCIYLLGLYEVRILNADTGFMSAEWAIHSKGLIELLRQRGPEQFNTLHGRQIFWAVINIVQLHSVTSGLDCPHETFVWLNEIDKHCALPEDYVLFRPIIFAHHCTNLCSRVQRLVQYSPFDEILASVPSIIQDMDEVEKITSLNIFSHNPHISSHEIEHPLALPDVPDYPSQCYFGILIYQYYFRMQLSHRVRELLQHASKAPSCTPQQRATITWYEKRCATEFHALVDK